MGSLRGPTAGPRNLGNSESGICPGVSWNLHTRNLGIWNLRRSILESAHEETRNLEIGFPPRTYRGALESWKLGNSESGICRGVSWNLHTWKHEIWILGSLRGPTEGHRKLGNMESGIWVSVLQGCPSPPPPSRSGLPLIPPRDLPALVDRGSTAYRKWTSFMIVQCTCTSIRSLLVYGQLERNSENLEKFCVRVQNAIGTEIRSTKNDHLRHYFPIVPSLTISYVDSQRTQRYTRHRRVTTVSSDRSLK